MNEAYQVVSPTDTGRLSASREVAGLFSKDGQLILPLVDLVEQAQCAIDDLVDVMGRATIDNIRHSILGAILREDTSCL